MIVDREHGKALLEITVSEGPQYRVGDFDGGGEPPVLDRRGHAVLPVHGLDPLDHVPCD